MRILVLGYMTRGPLGGMAWHHMQFVLGLKKMGHDVLFMEDSDDYDSCYNPHTYEVNNNPQFGLKFTSTFFNDLNISDSWTYFDWHTNTWYGLPGKKAIDFSKTADIVLNISCINPVREWWANAPARVLIDTDPGFVQIKNLTNQRHMALAKEHNNFFSFAENIGKPDCTIPDDGFKWKPTRQCLMAEIWKPGPPLPHANWTTIMQWDSYKSPTYNGKLYGMKSASFEQFRNFPSLMTYEHFEIGLGAKNEIADELKKEGWIIVDPYPVSNTPWIFRDYLANSKGEWTVAKQGYIETNSGWFSDRSLHYMALGKPVVIQETGINPVLKQGKGLITFSNPEESIAAVQKINSDYELHCKAARELAVDYFNHERVLGELLNRILA